MGEEQQFGKHLRFIPEKRRADDMFGGCALVYLWSMLEEVGVLVAGVQVVEKHYKRNHLQRPEISDHA